MILDHDIYNLVFLAENIKKLTAASIKGLNGLADPTNNETIRRCNYANIIIFNTFIF